MAGPRQWRSSAWRTNRAWRSSSVWRAITRIGSSRSALSSRTALIARIAASPRLTIARRVMGVGVAVTPPLCDGRHRQVQRAPVQSPPLRSGRTRRMAGSTTLDLWDPGSGRAVLDPVTLERHEMQLHGHRVSYRTAGSGPALLLLHGIANSSETWERAASLLCERFTLIAPDLMGHGNSATPRGDYSLGAHASSARDIATALGHERMTVLGHSLGGGIAMQFAYQFPARVERLVLVSSGGLGREVNLMLRAAALPGAEQVLPLIVASWLVSVGTTVARGLDRIGLRVGTDLAGMGEGLASLHTREAR